MCLCFVVHTGSICHLSKFNLRMRENLANFFKCNQAFLLCNSLCAQHVAVNSVSVFWLVREIGAKNELKRLMR